MQSITKQCSLTDESSMQITWSTKETQNWKQEFLQNPADLLLDGLQYAVCLHYNLTVFWHNLHTFWHSVNLTPEDSEIKPTPIPLSKYRNNCSSVITACTVVQAVVKATSQSNGKGQILTPWGSETPERISMKLRIYNRVRVAGMTTHANPCGAATTWVVWANTWKNTCCGFLGVPF